jgi:large subunit ribosomal protein L1
LLDRQKARPKIITPEDKRIIYNPFQALQLLRVHTFSSFTETVEVCIQLGVNPKNGEQIVRGSAFMPAGLGKTTKVAVLCDDSLKTQLSTAGVDKFIDK